MTWRLVLGLVSLQRGSLLTTIGFVSGLANPRMFPEWLTGGFVLLIVCGVGWKAHDVLQTRALAPLPLGPRELHRAGWLLLALVPLVLLTLARVLVGALYAWLSDGGWAFPASPVRLMFDVLYLGLCGASVVREQSRPDPPSLVAFLILIAVPFIAIPLLPERVSEIPLVLWVCGFVAFGVGLRPLIWPPDVYRRDFAPSTLAGAALAGPARGVALGQSFRAAGIWVPLRDVAAQALTLTVVILVFTAILRFRIADVVFWQPFAQSPADLRFLAVIGMLIMFVLGWLPGLGPWIGALKRLPISSRTVALLMSVTPSTTLVMLWSALLIIHVAVAAQWPETLRLGPLMAFIGLASLVDALGIKAGSSRTKYWIGAPVPLVFVYAMGTNWTLLTALMDHWALPLAGLLCLALSWGVNLHTLTRSPGSSRAFRFGWSNQRQGAE